MALDSADALKVIDTDGAFVVQSGVTSKEVVVGDEENGQGNSAIEILEAATGSGVEFICAVEPFDDLFELAVFGAFFIFIGQADDRASFKREGGSLEQSRVVDGVDSGVIGRVAVADEFGGDIFRHSSECFGKGDKSIMCASGVGEMICMNST